MQNMSVRSIPIYITNLATSEEILIFGAPFGLLWRPNAIWCDMMFNAHHLLQHITHILCPDGYFCGFGGSGEGGAVCISVAGKQPKM